MMETITLVLQLVIACVIFSVWIIRPNWKTPYRAGDAINIKEEFAVYGLPDWSVYVVGATKIALAIALLAGYWKSELVVPAAISMAILMAGAVLCHLRIKEDSISRAVPASSMLLMSLFVALI
ncbi:DoxX family protein [Euryarchaeota archaeon]|nr:DoxX family protein [Euryarchaeota archaeon]